MEVPNTHFAIFIDYDNLEQAQKLSGVLTVVTNTLLRIPLSSVTKKAECEVRVYGGWYEGSAITRRGQDLVVELQKDFPKTLRLPLGHNIQSIVSIRAELAVSLLIEPNHHLFNTYRRKGRPANIGVESPASIGCSDPKCLLPQVKSFLKSGACPHVGCSNSSSNLIYRHEQKIVDTMLSCDLLQAGRRSETWVILVSGDDDFLPPLRTIGLQGTQAVRVHPKTGHNRSSFPLTGTALVELDL